MFNHDAGIAPPELSPAVAEARRLVAESHGTNLDPIYQALDRSLLARSGAPRQPGLCGAGGTGERPPATGEP